MKIVVIAVYLSKNDPIMTKFDTLNQTVTIEIKMSWPKFKFFKTENGERTPYCKTSLVPITPQLLVRFSENFVAILQNFDCNDCRTSKISSFENSRWRTGAPKRMSQSIARDEGIPSQHSGAILLLQRWRRLMSPVQTNQSKLATTSQLQWTSQRPLANDHTIHRARIIIIVITLSGHSRHSPPSRIKPNNNEKLF